VTALAPLAATQTMYHAGSEPPLIPVLPAAQAAERPGKAFETRTRPKGLVRAWRPMTSWRGEFTDDYFAQPAPDPAQFAIPTEDDGTRDDPLLSDRS